MNRTRFLQILQRIAFSLAITALVAACDSAEERAEAHFQAGMALLEKGDVERALVEFRNVFKLNGRHKQARLTYARLERERGNISAAYGQYLRLIEQYPDNLEGRRALAEMALETGNWEELKRHGVFAASLAPNDLGIQSLNNALAYANSIRSADQVATATTVHVARDLVTAAPALMTARQVLIDHLLRNQKWQDALSATDAALAVNPNQTQLYVVRLGILNELNWPAEKEAQLKQMIDLFPEDEGVQQMLLQHYIEYRNLQAAEQFLRATLVSGSEDPMPVQRLAAFLNDYRGPAAAISEMDRIIARGGPNTTRFKAMRAVLKFQAGATETAIGEMQALLESSERNADTRAIEVEFARILVQAGNPAAAHALIETILAEDPTQVEALKFKAAWLIDKDEIGEAIILLREALGQAPRDPQLMTLMARAHERNGDQELMGEMLALAVEASLKAPDETLRYAQYLVSKGDLTIAESVLEEARRLAPGNLDLLTAMGQLYLQTENWNNLETIIRMVSDFEDLAAKGTAHQLRAAMLGAQQRTDDLTAFLTQLTRDPDFSLPAEIALVRTMLSRNDIPSASARLDQLLAVSPKSLSLQFVKAHLLTSNQNYDEAEALYRSILEKRPDLATVWMALHSLQLNRGTPEKARAVLQDALIALPTDFNLLMLQAASHERAGDLDAAINVYEKLYDGISRAQVVANNLASLLTTHRTDDKSLQRAVDLVRRLRGTRVPAFQDTYGWIAYRTGNFEEALQYLEAAASEMPNQPLVLYHLGKTYSALDRDQDALRAYKTAYKNTQSTAMPRDLVTVLLSEIEQLEMAQNTGQ
ncbi:tetratricopeptide repeat protein [Ruegeria meonggei]|uniref:Tetratricopeptide repeat protein n=1 Tax=Ruegeria meonggei TaxID=1446476 RepID=A0A1X7AET7_9RHOB|nr:tetratricopeptide repeat protein [Ruegeria meonggei]SLN76025.1 tetratricopeptide repeat protein [Ruegeria meonggei]